MFDNGAGLVQWVHAGDSGLVLPRLHRAEGAPEPFLHAGRPGELFWLADDLKGASDAVRDNRGGSGGGTRRRGEDGRHGLRVQGGPHVELSADADRA